MAMRAITAVWRSNKRSSLSSRTIPLRRRELSFSSDPVPLTGVRVLGIEAPDPGLRRSSHRLNLPQPPVQLVPTRGNPAHHPHKELMRTAFGRVFGRSCRRPHLGQPEAVRGRDCEEQRALPNTADAAKGTDATRRVQDRRMCDIEVVPRSRFSGPRPVIIGAALSVRLSPRVPPRERSVWPPRAPARGSRHSPTGPPRRSRAPPRGRFRQGGP